MAAAGGALPPERMSNASFQVSGVTGLADLDAGDLERAELGDVDLEADRDLAAAARAQHGDDRRQLQQVACLLDGLGPAVADGTSAPGGSLRELDEYSRKLTGRLVTMRKSRASWTRAPSSRPDGARHTAMRAVPASTPM